MLGRAKQRPRTRRAFEAHVLVTVVAPSALTVEGELARTFKLSR